MPFVGSKSKLNVELKLMHPSACEKVELHPTVVFGLLKSTAIPSAFRLAVFALKKLLLNELLSSRNVTLPCAPPPIIPLLFAAASGALVRNFNDPLLLSGKRLAAATRSSAVVPVVAS